MANYISKIMFGKGLDKNGGRKHTGKQGIALPFFLSGENCKFFKAYFSRFTTGRIRLFLFEGKSVEGTVQNYESKETIFQPAAC